KNQRSQEGAKQEIARKGVTGVDLFSAVLWRIPLARDGQARGHSDPKKRIEQGHSVGLGDQVGGQLNPTWVEWLMGYPAGWTELNASVTQWFRSKRGKRSKN